jgi:hypothetical protein
VLCLAAGMQTVSAEPMGSGLSGKIVACFKDASKGNKKMTIQQMRDCSGVWVTPRALLQWSLRMKFSFL